MKALLYQSYLRSERLSRFLRRRIMAPGWFAIACTFLMGLTGLDTNWSIHYQIFSLLFALVFFALLSLLFVQKPRVKVERFMPRFATVGTPIHYRVTITNIGRRRLRSVQLREWMPEFFPSRHEFLSRREPLEDQRNLFDRLFVYYRWRWLVEALRPARSAISEPFTLDPGATTQLTLRLDPLHRAVLALTEFRVITRDSFGFFSRARQAPVGPLDTLFILPRRYALPFIDLPGRIHHRTGGQLMAAGTGQSEEFMSIRDYRPGDPPRHLHWRSWARLNRPVVKEFEQESFPRYALVLDTLVEDSVNEVAFEEAVSIAASFAMTVETREALLDLLFVENRTYCFTAGGRGAESESARMLEVLASVRSVTDGGMIDSLTAAVLGRADSISACILLLLSWDDERAELVRRLRARRIPSLTMVITRETVKRLSLPQGSVHLRCGEIASDLAKLPRLI